MNCQIDFNYTVSICVYMYLNSFTLFPELKENIAKVGADIKDRVMRSIKSTWATINDFARAHTSSGQAAITDEQQLSEQVDAALQGVTAASAEDTSADLECESHHVIIAPI